MMCIEPCTHIVSPWRWEQAREGGRRLHAIVRHSPTIEKKRKHEGRKQKSDADTVRLTGMRGKREREGTVSFPLPPSSVSTHASPPPNPSWSNVRQAGVEEGRPRRRRPPGSPGEKRRREMVIGRTGGVGAHVRRPGRPPCPARRRDGEMYRRMPRPLSGR